MKTLCKLLALLALFFGENNLFSQTGASHQTLSARHAPEEKQDKFSLIIRGKAIGFFIIEDVFFSTATAGAELSIRGGHSLGADLTFFGWRYEQDDDHDKPLYETFEKRNYIYLDYKFRFLELKEYDLYLNVYDKAGLYRFWHEGVAESYTDWERPFLSDKTKGRFNEAGAGIGLKKFFSDRFYLDMSLNGGKVFSTDHTLTYDPGTTISVEKFDVRDRRLVFYIRLNFGFILKGNYAMKPGLNSAQTNVDRSY